MSQIINSNVMSLNAQRNLSTSGSQLAQSLQRLSSGLRINSAKDDAAGLAISQRFTAQIRGTTTAMRNAQDAVSLTQTAEGALGSVQSNLQRMRELAVQSANGTNTQADRDALNNEYTQLKAEIQRVAEQTKFAGSALLNGTFSAVFQVGANVGESITIGSIANVQVAALGGTYERFTATIDAATLTGFGTAIADNTVTLAHISGTGTVNLGEIAAAGSAKERAGQVVEAVNRVSSQTGVYASYDSETAKLTLSKEGSSGIVLAGTGATAAGFGWAAGTIGAAANVVGVDKSSLKLAHDAQSAIGLLDKAINAVSTSRANVGAFQSRFESAIANLMTTSENLTASRSRIMDADFAEETAKLTRAQVLQQAGVAMLAQANAVPQNVLSLLR
jgi:flagellin